MGRRDRWKRGTDRTADWRHNVNETPFHGGTRQKGDEHTQIGIQPRTAIAGWKGTGDVRRNLQKSGLGPIELGDRDARIVHQFACETRAAYGGIAGRNGVGVLRGDPPKIERLMPFAVPVADSKC